MSWEEMSRRKSPCDCDKGELIDISEMDDWNRTRSYHIINCDDCRQKAEKLAEQARQIEVEKEAQLKVLIEDIKSHFEVHYLEDWVALFDGVKNKKEAWALANRLGVEKRSLSSFYNHNKGLNIEQYSRDVVAPYNMLSIVKALGAIDDSLENKIKEAKRLRGAYFRVGLL